MAGTQGAIHIANIVNRNLIFHFSSELEVNSFSYCLDPHEPGGQGKPRIRLSDAATNNAQHAYLWLSALLLLPKPKRELNQTPNGPLEIRNDIYAISTIPFLILEQEQAGVKIQPTALELKNRSGELKTISIPARLASVYEAWRKAATGTDQLSFLIRAHQQAVTSNPVNHKSISESLHALQALLHNDGDILPIILNQLGVEPLADLAVPIAGENQAANPLLLKREIIKQWRLAAVRGSAANTFKYNVQSAYNYRCAFTGLRLPMTELTYTPGVDAAHILPWSRYDINVVNNGICLSKLCHWAFDNGVLRLDFNPSSSRYRLSVPEAIVQVAAPAGFDLNYFQSLAGELPQDRFPASPDLRPSREYLEHLNSELF